MTTPQQQPFAPEPVGYGQPPAQPAGYGPPVARRTNVLSIVALIAAFFVPLAAVVCGWVSLRQIARSGENGRPLAITALVLGGIGCAMWILFWVLIIANGGSFSYSYSM
ncbi:DUF4190 domain-containing protein [Actinomycetospora sp. NBRC 106378]|uniref:DUF4190 domain-containing protein n=1 Tax=Actinomycetospora sp. NBRC 106378 TaxID=3032208 RepID=UPI0024A2AA51|nr:DUF4190 domain-containing protein [Actinomycetospora sp. NBRC 106378]GLZ51442.1 hypothetical protein Acsp07_10590 [Actinomycetospora sp. NBRC 106378]